jgi:uncharacterized repeat protein (TIGR03803 family)
MSKSRNFGWRLRGSTVLQIAAIAAVTASVAPAALAKGVSYEVLYDFSFGTDGFYPYASLIEDSAGNLYGANQGGGDLSCPNGESVGCGNVFEIAPNGAETVLYSFVGAPTDGFYPGYGSLIRDSAGNFYGTTEYGGTSNYPGGTVFKLAPDGAETLLYSFCPGGYPCADGWNPVGGVIADAKGNLYGTTSQGGASNNGTVFEIAPDGTETVLYSFTGGADGAYPAADLTRIGGNIYGTAAYGGADGDGTVFELVKGKKGPYTFKLLYSFTGGSDGANPYADLTADKAGNLYSTANAGGAYGYGNVFKLAPDGTETVLYSFAGTGANDGQYPFTGLVMKKGNLYGMTFGGGAAGNGTVFGLTPDGTETVIHSFAGDTDGGNPVGSGPLVASGGYLYGTTGGGNYTDIGTVFKVKY